MNKTEFLEELRSSLKGQIHDFEIERHIKYYSDYFSQEMAKGNSEEDVCNQLGSARLIARTLIETSDVPMFEKVEESYEETKRHDESNSEKSFLEKVFILFTDRKSLSVLERIYIAVAVFAIVFAIIAVLIFIGRIIVALIPIIILIMLLFYIFKLFV